MKCFLIFLLLIYAKSFVFAQSLLHQISKPPLDNSIFNHWPGVIGGIISDNGNYVSYVIHHSEQGNAKLVVQSVANNWEMNFIGATNAVFTHDNKWIIFKKGADSLCLVRLGKNDVSFISYVSKYEVQTNDEGVWLSYLSTKPENKFVLRNLSTGKEFCFLSVTDYIINASVTYVLIKLEKKKDSLALSSMQIISLLDFSQKWIWSRQNEKPISYTFDASGEQIAIITEREKEDELISELWYYRDGMDTAIMLVSDQLPVTDERFGLLSRKPEFSKDGRRILFWLKLRDKPKPSSDFVRVDVWSYIDPELQSLQKEELKYDPSYAAVIDPFSKKTIRIEQQNERIIGYNNDFALIIHGLGNYGVFEANWNLAAQFAYYLVSLKDGTRKMLRDHIQNHEGQLGLSPGGRYIVYYDCQQKNYFSYKVNTGETCNITKGIPVNWTNVDDDQPQHPITWYSNRNTWLSDDEVVLINDNYDIWQIDPSGIRLPLNFTNGYGQKHHIKFELLYDGDILNGNTLKESPKLLLTGFNKANKDYGFYCKTMGIIEDPTLLSMGPYVYSLSAAYSSPPKKAKDANIYLVARMSALESPNYFLTKDFKTYASLTDVKPERKYNWMTTELVHWKTLNGSLSTGILYKPEDFDSTKRYPLLFDYYERRSDELNVYVWPGPADDRINIAWFVSNGYLVFVPDIHYKIGEPGASAYNSVVSAATYLSKFHWVDSKRLGIQGHSFGGYETNYLITHTSIFAAACAASGICDLISSYGSTARGSFQRYHSERNQGRLGATLWQSPDVYIKNSPIFRADRVATPLLMMNNIGDQIVSFSQGVEFFTALRRLGKRVWMLQYDNGRHSVSESAAIDYNTRMTQFFDHYLKGKPAPKWMTIGIPARMKGTEDGLEMDDTIMTPGPGLNHRISDR